MNERAKPKARGARPDRGAPPAPTEASLREAALAALARRAFTRAGLAEALGRKVANWARKASRDGHHEPEEVARAAEKAREAIEPIVDRMIEIGAVNDARFAEARAARLARQGRSRRAIAAHLAAKGVEQVTVREATAPDAGTELFAALTLAKKRRLGPFARDREESAGDAEARRKALGVFARAGFDMSTAQRALRMDPDEADEILRDRRAL